MFEFTWLRIAVLCKEKKIALAVATRHHRGISMYVLFIMYCTSYWFVLVYCTQTIVRSSCLVHTHLPTKIVMSSIIVVWTAIIEEGNLFLLYEVYMKCLLYEVYMKCLLYEMSIT